MVSFVGAVLSAVPNLTRRELLFAVPVPPDFRESPAGRHAISRFRAIVATAVLAGVCALLLSPTKFLNTTAAVVPMAILLACGISLIMALAGWFGSRRSRFRSAMRRLPALIENVSEKPTILDEEVDPEDCA
jgi:hypothetical protein